MSPEVSKLPVSKHETEDGSSGVTIVTYIASNLCFLKRPILLSYFNFEVVMSGVK